MVQKIGQQAKTTDLAVFISYSRKDLEFVEALAQALSSHNVSVYLDKTDIAPGEDWKKRLAGLISEADTIVYVISPDSIGSEMCRFEIRTALKLNKRIIPIVCRAVSEADAPAELSSLNWLFFIEQNQIEPSFRALIASLNTDIEWVREHTKLTDRAERWDKGRASALQGHELEVAEQWLTSQPKGAPPPSDLQRRLIAESRRLTRKRQRLVVGVSVSAAAIALVLAGYAFWQQRQATQSLLQAQQRERETVSLQWLYMLTKDVASGTPSSLGEQTAMLEALKARDPDIIGKLAIDTAIKMGRDGVPVKPGESTVPVAFSDLDFLRFFARYFSSKEKYTSLELSAGLGTILLAWPDEQLLAFSKLLDLLLDPEAPTLFTHYRKNIEAKDVEYLKFVQAVTTATAQRDSAPLKPLVSSRHFKAIFLTGHDEDLNLELPVSLKDWPNLAKFWSVSAGNEGAGTVLTAAHITRMPERAAFLAYMLKPLVVDDPATTDQIRQLAFDRMKGALEPLDLLDNQSNAGYAAAFKAVSRADAHARFIAQVRQIEDKGELKRAAALYDWVLPSDRYYPAALLRRANLLGRLGDTDAQKKTLADLADALAVTLPEDQWLPRGRALLAQAEKPDIDRIAELVEADKSLSADLRAAWLRRCAARSIDTKEPAEGAKFYRKVTELVSGEHRAEALGGLSWASLLSGNFEDAFKAASEALAQFPDKSWIKTNLITAAVLTGRTDEAKSRYAAAKEERIGDQTLTDVLLKDLADVAAAAKSDPRLDEFKTWLASN